MRSPGTRSGTVAADQFQLSSGSIRLKVHRPFESNPFIPTCRCLPPTLGSWIVMSISFSCPNCGKDFKTDAGLAGKKCKCKQCDHVFVIPAARGASPSGSVRPLTTFDDAGPSEAKPSRPAPKPARPAAAAARPSRPNYLDDDFDPYSIDDAMPLPPRKAEEVDEEEDYRGPSPVATRPRKKTKRSSSGPFAGLPPIYYGIVAGVAGVGVLAGAAGITSVSVVLGAVGILGALVPLLYGSIGVLVVPFYEGALHGIACFMLWPYQLFYLITRWSDMKGPFLTYLGGVGLMVLSAMPFVFIASKRPPGQPPQFAQTPWPGPELPDGFPQPPSAPLPPGMVRPPRLPGMPEMPGIPTPPGFVPRPQGVPGAPRQPSNPDTVVLVVTGLGDKATEEDFDDKLKGMLETSYGRCNMFGTGNFARKTYNVSPIPDAKALADRITWAKVTRVDDRTIEVVATPLPAADRRPPDSDFAAQVLFDLKSPTQNKRRDALRRIANAPPTDDGKEEIARAIEPLLKDPDGFTRSEAAKALGVWGGKENADALVGALRDPAFNVVWAVFDALERLRLPETAGPVASFMAVQQNRNNAAKVLVAIGPPAEPAVIPLLSHGDQFVRMEAAQVLEKIGGEACVPALQELIRKTNGHGLDAMAAGKALDQLGAPRFAQPARGKKGGLVPRSRNR